MPTRFQSPALSIAPGVLDEDLAAARRSLSDRHFVSLLERRDPSLWSSEPAVQKAIANRLGWLNAPDGMLAEIPRIEQFAAAVRDEGVADVVLLGMGGSSLAPEVMRAVSGVQPAWPRFTMIDSVNPDHLRGIVVDPRQTLFVLASKSGSTIEPNALAAYFRQRLIDAKVTDWGRHFVAITDPGTSLDQRAAREHFRAVFRNPADIGGRYSALSLFGLVPAALMGLDIRGMVADARRILEQTRTPSEDAAIVLGALLGAAARAGRDKLTLLLPPPLEAFGLWVEQLVAESTGKSGKGIVPIAGEPLGAPAEYGDDRVIVHLRIGGAGADEPDALVADLQRAGAPVAVIEAGQPLRLGAEFVRWELATVAAAALLEINPFDEPNVQQAKDATRALLDSFAREGRLPAAEPDAEIDHAAFTLTATARKSLGGRAADAFLSVLRPRDYFAILAYLPESPEMADAFRRFRGEVRRRSGCATMFGYGPRYLHSTGQLHKGGGTHGAFLILTAPGQDVPVPGETFSFGVLELAQALGDLASLDQVGRRALHVHLPRADRNTLQRCFDRLLENFSGQR